MEGEQQGLLKTLTGARAGNMLEVAKLQELYGKAHPYEDRYDGSGRSSMSFASPSWMYHPQRGYFQTFIDKETASPMIAGTREPIPEGSVPVNQLYTTSTDDARTNTQIKGTGEIVATTPPGTTRSTPPRNPLNPPQPTDQRLADDTVRFVYDDIMKRAAADFTYDMASAAKKLELERKAYDTHAPENVKVQYPTWDAFKQRRAVRVTPTPVSTGTSDDMDDEALLKAIAADLAKRNAPPQSAPIK
jgi:hypothetical protein